MKRLSVIFFLLLAAIMSKAQNPVEFQNVIPVSTVSPNSASLGKFGNIPVSYATGVPSVTIPLYEINIGKIKIPLSLDYHGGGVRVDEVSSSVGTSWALSGLPEISRNMIGLPDENTGSGYLYAPSLDSLYNYYKGSQYGGTKDDNFAQFILNVRDNIRDTEPDVFSYTLNGASGKFMYKPNGAIMQIPVTNNKIERTTGNNFKVTDENGMVYFFDQQELTQMVSASGTGPGTYVSSWHVSKMVAPNVADTIFFRYTSNSGSTEHSWNFSYTLGDKPVMDQSTGAISYPDASGENSSVSTTAHPIELFPNEIDWRGGKVTFSNARDRTDRPTEFRLDSVKVYSKLNGAFQLVKSVKLYQSYFYSNPVNGKTADYRNYRLRLDSVAYLPAAGSLAPQKYLMTYNNSPIAPNESYGQDIWGYNNGQFNNITMMPKQTVLWKGVYLTIGEANIDPDSTNSYVQACMLQSIQYPTKGKSVFTFEPHKYSLNYQTTQQQSVGCDAFGSIQSSNTTTFTVSANQSAFRYSVTLSAYSYPGIVISGRPQVQMVDQTTGQQVFLVNNVSNPTQAYSTGTIALSLTVGHTYVIHTNIYTSDSRVQATCLVSWMVPVTGTTVKTGGGLRVSSITNYDNNGNFISKETYQYGGSGYGTLLTAASYLLLNYENTFYQLGYMVPATVNGLGTPCLQATSHPDIVYHAKSVYPATQFSGTPVVYNSVSKFDTDNSGNTNGKSVYTYTIYQDQVYNYGPTGAAMGASLDSTTVGNWLISGLWKNGIMDHEYTYKTSGTGYSPVIIKQFNYQVYRPDTLAGLKIKPLYIKMTGCENIPDTTDTRANPFGNFNNWVHYFMGRIPTYTGAMLLQNETDTTFDNAGHKLVEIHNTYYDDLTHILPTRKEMFNSKGDDLVDVIQYPHNLAAAGNVYQTMLNRNMIAPVVGYQQKKNGNQLTFTNIYYNDWFSNGNLLQEQSVSEQVLSNASETRVNYNRYDVYGNILQQQKTSAPYLSYQWGYNTMYPVATVKNAPVNDIFYDSFEEGDGNSNAGDAKTGHFSYIGGTNPYSKTLNNLDPGAYTISYWSKTGNGSWSFVSQPVTVTGNSYPFSIPGQIDDVRFYPAGAEMNTFTYDPLIGMTSSADAKNEITFYEFDGFERLVNVKDKDGNVVKHYDYHLQGQ